jgi:hypothetical protein
MYVSSHGVISIMWQRLARSLPVSKCGSWLGVTLKHPHALHQVQTQNFTTTYCSRPLSQATGHSLHHQTSNREDCQGCTRGRLSIPDFSPLVHSNSLILHKRLYHLIKSYYYNQQPTPIYLNQCTNPAPTRDGHQWTVLRCGPGRDTTH